VSKVFVSGGSSLSHPTRGRKNKGGKTSMFHLPNTLLISTTFSSSCFQKTVASVEELLEAAKQLKTLTSKKV